MVTERRNEYIQSVQALFQAIHQPGPTHTLIGQTVKCKGIQTTVTTTHAKGMENTENFINT